MSNLFELLQKRSERSVLISRLQELDNQISALENPVTISNFSVGIANSHCQACNLDLSKPMGYMCSNSKCPVQPKLTS